ncbi:MAG: zinc ribbon domain-containing protein [Phycisphaerales bacterium]
MLIVSLILILIGLALLVLAMRGRIVARGSFCRACGFDLHGLMADDEASKCPECGREVGKPGTTRAIRKARSRRLLVVSIVLLLIGSGLSVMHFSGNASSFYSAMPHRIVLSASKWGDDDAIDELIARLSPKQQTPEWVWEDAIDCLRSPGRPE